MHKISDVFKPLTVLLCALSFCSCLSINRNIKLNKDGSGQETMNITFLKEFYGIMSSMASIMDTTRKEGYLDSLYNDEIFINKTRSEYDSIPGVKLVDISSERNPDSSNTFIIKYDFDNIKSIGSSMSSIGEDKDDSETLVTWLKEGGNVLFSYHYEDAALPDSSGADSLTLQMKTGMSEMFAGGGMHFEIEFPYDVISSNATSTEGNKLIWDFSMSDLFIKGSMKLEAVMKDN